MALRVKALEKTKSIGNVSSTTGSTSNMNVFVRVRPPNQRELDDCCRTVVKVVDEKLLVFDPKEESEPFFFHGSRQKVRDMAKKQNKEIDFLFDGVFGPDTTNMDVHTCTTHNIINRLLEGYNCSVFVYGATGAGKTFTMLGNAETQRGIMYFTMAELYRQIEMMAEEKKSQVGVSFVEVYNENVYDLLNPSGPLFLREDANGVTIVGLRVENISNADQLLEKLAQGNRKRTQHPTDANAESSRSHAVFQVYIRMVSLDNGQVKIAKLSMIDLAGSERGVATGCKGMRFKEGSNINKSLLALGNCISSLADGLRHIPYRDSKLTRLLKDSLGGNCQTVMIANISPSSASYEDTYNTLKFASRAKKITAKLTKNVISLEMHVSHYVKLVDDMKKEIMLLKSQARASEQTATDSGRLYAQMPKTSVWSTHLDTLFDEKLRLYNKILNVKSEANLLEWRIKYKKFSQGLLKNTPEIPASTINRIELSISQFEARLDGLRRFITDVNQQLSVTNDKLSKLYQEMEEARVYHLMSKDIEIKNSILVNTRLEVCVKHLTRLYLLQQRRAETSENTTRVWLPIMTDNHLLLSGHNIMTNSMAMNYKNAIKMMEGIKTVSWCDAETDESVVDKFCSAINVSFDDDDALLTSDTYMSELKPTFLPIMNDLNDEEMTNNIETDEFKMDENDINHTISEINGLVCNTEDQNNINNLEDSSPLNTTITIETEGAPSSISAPSNTDIELLPPSTCSAVSNKNISVQPEVLNQTITVDGSNKVKFLSNLKKKSNYNMTFIKAKRSKPLLKDLPVSSLIKRSNISSVKENLQMSNDTKNIIIEKSNIKDSNLKQPMLKTPSISSYHGKAGRILSRPALRPLNVSSNISLQTITNNSAIEQVPNKNLSLKVIHTKKRFKSHPYKRPEINSTLKKIDKRR